MIYVIVNESAQFALPHSAACAGLHVAIIYDSVVAIQLQTNEIINTASIPYKTISTLIKTHHFPKRTLPECLIRVALPGAEESTNSNIIPHADVRVKPIERWSFVRVRVRSKSCV